MYFQLQLSEAIARVHRYVGAVTGKRGHVVEQAAKPEDLKRRLERAAKLDPTVQSWLDNMTFDPSGLATKKFYNWKLFNLNY